MAHSKKEREHYNKMREMAGKSLGLTKNQYNALRRVSHELSRHGEHEANTGESRSKEMGKAFQKAEKVRKKLGGKHSIHFYHQTDPRGVALYASKKRMSRSRYNTEGHPIY